MGNAIRLMVGLAALTTVSPALADGDRGTGPGTQARRDTVNERGDIPAGTELDSDSDLRFVGSGRGEPSQGWREVKGEHVTALTALEMAREADEIQFGFRPL